MTPLQQRVNVTGGAANPGSAVHLLITEGERQKMAQSPEQVMEEINRRATRVGPVLESIFLDIHDHPDWGIND